MLVSKVFHNNNTKWFLHASVDYDMKKFNLIPLSISKAL